MQILRSLAYGLRRLAMTDWVILATGQSLDIEDVNYVRGKCKVVAVSNAYELAPWADVLVSYDSSWWRSHSNALNFTGPKYCGRDIAGTQHFRPPDMPIGCNSGLMAMYIAKDLGASRILLLGFDMHGTHYFGPHPEGLKNTAQHRFIQHINQFSRFKGPQVLNCTKHSALNRYPMANLRDLI